MQDEAGANAKKSLHKTYEMHTFESLRRNDNIHVKLAPVIERAPVRRRVSYAIPRYV